jgi:hypothetical protein
MRRNRLGPLALGAREDIAEDANWAAEAFLEINHER